MTQHNEPGMPEWAAIRFRKRLREARRNAGMTQADLAKVIGVTRVAVSAWENGTSPKAYTLVKVARRLGVSAEWLVGFEAA